VAAWAIYMTVVVASNGSDLLASFGWIHTAFRSGNLAFIQTATRVYFHSRPVDQVLLGCVLAWEASAARLLWMAFAIVTELFVAYDRGVTESAYWVLAIANLVTLVVVGLCRRDAA
jgi:hypothetical protein